MEGNEKYLIALVIMIAILLIIVIVVIILIIISYVNTSTSSSSSSSSSTISSTSDTVTTLNVSSDDDDEAIILKRHYCIKGSSLDLAVFELDTSNNTYSLRLANENHYEHDFKPYEGLKLVTGEINFYKLINLELNKCWFDLNTTFTDETQGNMIISTPTHVIFTGGYWTIYGINKNLIQFLINNSYVERLFVENTEIYRCNKDAAFWGYDNENRGVPPNGIYKYNDTFWKIPFNEIYDQQISNVCNNTNYYLLGRFTFYKKKVVVVMNLKHLHYKYVQTVIIHVVIVKMILLSYMQQMM